MRQLSLMLMLAGLIALSGCNNAIEKRLEDAKSQISVLEERLKGKDELIQQQAKTMESTQNSLNEALKVRSAATDDENLKKQIEILSGQYTTLFKQYNDQIASSMKEALKVCSMATGDENLKKQIERLSEQYTTLLKRFDERNKIPQPDDDKDKVDGGKTQSDHRPYTLGDPPPKDSNLNQDKWNEMLLLGAAYIACNYYSAGICGAVLAFVAQKLGITQDEVKTRYEKAYRQLPDGGRGIEVTLPDGMRITLKDPTTQSDNRSPDKVGGNNPPPYPISDTDVCTIVNESRSDPAKARFVQALLNPLRFPTVTARQTAVQAAQDAGHTSLAKALNSIPVGSGGLPCD